MSTDSDPPERTDLEIAAVSDPDLEGNYLLYPPNATDEELQRAWIRSEANDFVPLEHHR